MLLVESRPQRRAALARALEQTGLHVVAVPSVAHVERWPAGEVVATEVERFTPIWKRMGASHVIVFADNAAEGLECCARGATMWLPRDCRSSLVVDAVGALESGRKLLVDGRDARSTDAQATRRRADAADDAVNTSEPSAPSGGMRIELIVRRGAQRRFDMLLQKSVGLPVVVRWDRRTDDRRRHPSGAPGDDRRRSDRREPPPFTWDVADFVVVEG